LRYVLCITRHIGLVKAGFTRITSVVCAFDEFYIIARRRKMELMEPII
jgi:hypothetical protein